MQSKAFGGMRVGRKEILAGVVAEFKNDQVIPFVKSEEKDLKVGKGIIICQIH